MNFVDVRFRAARKAIPRFRAFYIDRLGFAKVDHVDEGDLALKVGLAVARFSEVSDGSAPFYHFALLVPGNRFEAAYRWLRDRTKLLPDPETGEEVFEFDSWDALACYFLDPAENIVELIAHRGISETSTDGPFSATELVDFSEVGLVVPDKEQSVAALERGTSLRVWDGNIEDPDRIVFVGERARTLILARPGRGWLPTGRPAEIHPVEVTLETGFRGEVDLPGTPHSIRSE